MKKNTWLAIMCLGTLSSLVFAFYQKSKADRCMTSASQYEITIKDLTLKVERVVKFAEQSSNEAMVQSKRADLAVEECRKQQRK